MIHSDTQKDKGQDALTLAGVNAAARDKAAGDRGKSDGDLDDDNDNTEVRCYVFSVLYPLRGCVLGPTSDADALDMSSFFSLSSSSSVSI